MLTFLTGPVGAVRTEARLRFARHLADVLEEPVEVFPTPTYGELSTALTRDAGDFAWLPPAVYARAEDHVELLLGGVRASRAHFRGALFVRDDTRFESLHDLQGTRVGWVDRNSCAGYLFPRLGLLENGVDPEALFREERFLGDHLSVVRAVEDGDVDVGATFIHLAGDGADAPVAGTGWELEMPRDRMRMLGVSDPIPSDTLVAFPSTDPARRAQFTEALQSMHDAREGRRILGALFGVERFEPVLPAHYDTVRRALRAGSSS